MQVKLLRLTENPIELIAQAASTCYNRVPHNPESLVAKLFHLGHMSPFEHVTITFYVDGISRACATQLTRHRLASYTMESQRYTDASDTKYVLPKRVRSSKAKELLMDHYALSQKTYIALLQEGLAKEDARSVLPNATETKLVFSMNFRQFLHAYEERTCLEAQEEIRDLFKDAAALLPPELRTYCRPKCYRCTHQGNCDKRIKEIKASE